MEQRWTYCGVICCFENMEGLYRRSSRRRNCYLEMASYILMGKTRMDWIWYMQIQVGIVIFQTLNFCVENLYFIGHICTKLGLIYDQSSIFYAVEASNCAGSRRFGRWRIGILFTIAKMNRSLRHKELWPWMICGLWRRRSKDVNCSCYSSRLAWQILSFQLSVDCLPCTKSDKSLGLKFCAWCWMCVWL